MSTSTLLSYRTRQAAPRVLPWLLLLSAPAHAGSCDVIKPQVEAKLRAGGLSHFTVSVEDPGQVKAGRVVGTCDRGTRRLVYVQHATAAGAASRGAVVTGATSAASAAGATGAASTAAPEQAARRPAPGDSIPTECKDGSIVIGPDCDDPRAPRMTAAELAKPASAP